MELAMPGLVGILGDTESTPDLLDRMASAVGGAPFYRTDRWSGDGFAGARVHLGIFDPGPQPAVTSGGARVFFDGRSYGTEAATRALRDRGYAVRPGSDAGLCAAAFEEWGTAFFRELNGPFVCVIAEPDEGRVTIANDRYGLMPLSYAATRERFLVSTHLAALLEDPGLDRTIDPDAVQDFFAFGRLHGNRTLLRAVSAMPSGSVLRYSAGRVEIERYWDYAPAADTTRSEEWFVDELVRTWRRAVTLRAEPQYRCGITLSGGLDSRTITGGLPRDRCAGMVALTHGHPESDEVLMAQEVASVSGMAFLQVTTPTPFYLERPDECVRVTDGLDYIGVNYIPKASRLAREAGVEVLFHGMGPDLWIAGGLAGDWAGRQYPRLRGGEIDEALHRTVRFFPDDELDRLFLPGLRQELSLSPRGSFDAVMGGIGVPDPLDRHDHYMHATHQRRLAAMGPRLWRTATEVALPGFDNDWVDVALRIPPEYRLNRRIYRKFLSRLAPDLAAIPYNRTMVPPAYPLALWHVGQALMFQSDRLRRGVNGLAGRRLLRPRVRKSVDGRAMLRDDPAWDRFFRNLLLSDDSVIAGCLDTGTVGGLVDASRDGTLANPVKVLYLATFELFLRAYGLRAPGAAA
jgi:asparagine synthetase B (glutamine-hydrolysing)